MISECHHDPLYKLCDTCHLMNQREAADIEIKLLKNTVKALAKMNLYYRFCRSAMPEWVFDNLDVAKNRYGDDLTKII